MNSRLRYAWLVLVLLGMQRSYAATPVTIYLAGDSTMAQKVATKRPETGWGEYLQQYFDVDEVRVENHARNGRSTRTFISEGRWDALLDKLHANDYVFIQFGHNDASVEKQDRYTPPDDYRNNLLRFVADVRARQATPVLLTSVLRRRFDDAGVLQDSHGVYPDIVRDVARQQNVMLLDMYLRSMEWLRRVGPDASASLFMNLAPNKFANYPEGLKDNTHFTPEGAARVAELVVAEIAASGLPLAKQLKRVAVPAMVVVREEEVKRSEPPPHGAIGLSTVYGISDAVPASRSMEFRKRVLHVGAAIGLHLIDHDEVYYVLSGTGEVTSDGVTQSVEPGTAAYLFKGATVGIKQNGKQPLALIISYPNQPK
jgi:lysophospholipase L1-like esterase/mannose-6-phosphate isomerase-like protein (cupin superfamily)